MSTDFRALCRELTDVLAELPFGTCEELVVRGRAALAEPVPEDDVALLREALAATAAQRRAEDDARAALAEPEPEVAGPSDEELRDLWSLAAGQDQGPWPTQQHWFARAVLARWGRYDPPAAGAPCPPMEDVGPLIAWLAEQACQAADASQSTDAGMLTWAAQVIGERVDEDAPAPPAAGEVGELVALIHQISLAWEPDACLLGNMTAGQLTRAADLLAQRHPEPIPALPEDATVIEPSERTILVPHQAPVPESERPWEREGWCDEQGWCWFCNSYLMGQWSYSLPPSPGQGWGRLGTMTHSLPHWAIPRPRPLPQQETTNG